MQMLKKVPQQLTLAHLQSPLGSRISNSPSLSSLCLISRYFSPLSSSIDLVQLAPSTYLRVTENDAGRETEQGILAD